MALRTELLTRPSTKTTTPFGDFSSLKSRLAVLLAGLLFFAIGLIYYLSGPLHLDEDTHIRFKSHPQSRFNKSKTVKNGSIKIKQYPACPIPQLEPYHESIQHIVDNVDIPSYFNCTGSYPLLFNSTLQSTIIPAKGPDYFRDEGYESCCYRYRTGGESEEPSDDRNSTSPPCFPVSLTTETKIRDGNESIAIFCKRQGSENKTLLVDVQAFVPLKPKEGNPSNKANGTEEKFNVVIFGLDGMSRMNFLRMMPQSHSFLKNELEAVEMLGFNKVGDSTLPNVLAMVTGDLEGGGDVIWTEYAKQGYYTMASDDDDHSYWLFENSGMGFRDYDFRPVPHSADVKFKTSKSSCYGPRLTFQSLLDYMEKYVETMSRNKTNFFEFTWVTWLTHDYIHPARLGDPHLLKSLRWLKESGHLNNTIFILMSDHGNRLDLLRKTIQGQLEERLPILYFVVPEPFKRRYELAYKNLLSNADKLTTAFDLHESLKEILNLDMIENRKLSEREDELSRLGRDLPRGISLFLPIPEFRTCYMAGIIKNYCSCTYMGVANVSDPEIDVVAKAKIAVSHINSLLGSRGNNTACAILELHSVSRVMRVGYNKDYSWRGYSINFETKPGGGQFEALVAKVTDEGTHWEVQGPIVRTNLYGHQSHCVRNIARLKPYCYCLDYISRSLSMF